MKCQLFSLPNLASPSFVSSSASTFFTFYPSPSIHDKDDTNCVCLSFSVHCATQHQVRLPPSVFFVLGCEVQCLAWLARHLICSILLAAWCKPITMQIAACLSLSFCSCGFPLFCVSVCVCLFNARSRWLLIELLLLAQSIAHLACD